MHVTTAELIVKLRDPEMGYIAVRELEDGSVAALGDLLYTRAIFLNCNEFGYSKRFCFENRSLAVVRFNELRTEDDVPEGSVAHRAAPPT